MSPPILWSFRRCPYAMRARLALAASGIAIELREVVLRDKPQTFLDTSPSATVPCLETGAEIIDESLDIMLWALRQSDPDHWLDMPDQGHTLIATNDGPFKTALDHYKYPTRYAEGEARAARTNAVPFLRQLDTHLGDTPYLFGDTPKLADMAILPFIRQFAHVDLDWFIAQDWRALAAWLDRFKSSDRFAAIMPKFSQWHPDDAIIRFP